MILFKPIIFQIMQLTGRTAVGGGGSQGGLIRRGLAGMARSSSTGYLLGLGFVDEEGDALTISQSGVRVFVLLGWVCCR